MKFPIINSLITIFLIAGFYSCGTSSEKKDDHSHHQQEESASHSHDHGHSHKAETMTLSDGSYKVDTEKSFIKWTGKKITGSSHFGKLKLASGTVAVSGSQIGTDSEFSVDMTTITVEDIPADDAKNGKLKGHLENDDFFSTTKFPTTTFKVTQIAKGEKEGMINVTGDLTIKGITKSISFPAHIMNHDGTLHAMADIVFNRAEFDIKYKSSSFFSDLGDKAINDDIELELHLYAQK
ncbi:YceI family protein [Flammeovirga aprica]|uniref:YceI family protein n=1 Tax=Flammeovirga aprica JL-4 TaxID=694437 RepID=A0A7X9P2C9_9BACT|nr:YceI family protein [Flammeovirga aprica]NME67732.1 YceI family protein [Flammeovirga aprica JL-4]